MLQCPKPQPPPLPLQNLCRTVDCLSQAPLILRRDRARWDHERQLDSIRPTLNQIALLSGPGPFILLGLPGEEALHAWISVPMCLLYMAALAGNALLLGLVAADKTLQAPMYQMLGLLAATKLVLAISTVPKESLGCAPGCVR